MLSVGKKSAVFMTCLYSNNSDHWIISINLYLLIFGFFAGCHRVNHMGMLKRIASEKESEQAVDAEHKFAKKTIHSPLSTEISA